MAKYSMNRTASNTAQICKDGVCYDVDATSINLTWRAIQWDGTVGWAELCDGANYDINTGEQAISAESELSTLAILWQAIYDAEQAVLETASAVAAQAELDAQTPA